MTFTLVVHNSIVLLSYRAIFYCTARYVTHESASFLI